MNIENTKKVLKVLLKHKITPILWSKTGMGKSEVTRQLAEEMAKEKNLQFTTNPSEFDKDHYFLADIRLGQQEVGDLIGMPVPSVEKGMTIWLPPSWFPRNKDSQGIIFLDELNRARLDVLQAVFQLILDRRIHTHILPDSVHIISANNPSGAEYFVNELDPALMNRFCHLKFSPEIREWVAWGKNTKRIPDTVSDFIQKYPEMLGQEQIEVPISVKPTPRSWEMMARILPDLPEDLWLETCAGLIGLETAIPFLESLKRNLEKPVRAEQILNHYKNWKSKIKKFSATSDKGKSRLDLLRMSCDDVTRLLKKNTQEGKHLNKDQEANLVAFLRDIPSDLSFSVIKYLVSSDQMGTDEYNNLLCKFDDLYKKLEKVSELEK